MDVTLVNIDEVNDFMSVEQAARLLAAAGGRPVTVEMVRAAIDAGAPAGADPDGRGRRINLVEFMAWLEKDLDAQR